MWRGEEDAGVYAPGMESRKRCAISRKPWYRDGASASSTREELGLDSSASSRRSGCADPEGDEVALKHDRAGRRKVVSSMNSIATLRLGTLLLIYVQSISQLDKPETGQVMRYLWLGWGIVILVVSSFSCAPIYHRLRLVDYLRVFGAVM